MSANKQKYYEITTTQVVSANSQADAIAIASRQRGYTTLEGRVISSDTSAERVMASALRTV